MSSNNNFIEVIRLLQDFIPKIEANLLQGNINNPRVQIDQRINLAESINLTVNLRINEQESISILSVSESYCNNNQTSQQPLIDGNTTDNILEKEEAIFSSGIHIFINNQDWFAQPKEINYLDKLKVIPLLPKNQPNHKKISSCGLFKFILKYELSSQNIIKISLRQDMYSDEDEDENNLSDLELNQAKNLTLNQKEYRITMYDSEKVISFKEIPEIVVSMDKKIAKSALLIEELYSDNYNLPLESYLFIFPQEVPH